MAMRLDDTILAHKSRFYDAERIHVMVDDKLSELGCLQQGTGDVKAGDPTTWTPEQWLLECRKATITYLEMDIAYYTRMVYRTHAWMEDKGMWLLKIAYLRAILLHGKDCTIWKGADSRTRERIGWGRPSFGGFDKVCVERENDFQFFSFEDGDVHSSKYVIERSEEWDVVISN